MRNPDGRGMPAAEAFVVGAIVALGDGCDPAAVGAAVTSALCGHWEHEGPCRWPHNNAIDSACVPARFRTLYVAGAEEADLVAQRIRDALGSAAAWSVVRIERRPVDESDRPLAERLLSGPRACR